MPREKSNSSIKDSTANLGFEAKLWLAADTAPRVSANGKCAATWRDLRRAQVHWRNNMDAAEYKHVVLGLISLKYISDTAGKCRMANAKIRTRNACPLRHLNFDNRNSHE